MRTTHFIFLIFVCWICKVVLDLILLGQTGYRSEVIDEETDKGTNNQSETLINIQKDLQTEKYRQ